MQIEFTISEIVREKVFNLTEEEVPHSVTCVVEQIKKEKNNYSINVAIIVDRDSLKKIIIGKQGNKIKEIGYPLTYAQKCIIILAVKVCRLGTSQRGCFIGCP